MHEIKAIIQSFMRDKVLDALREIEGLPGIAVSEVLVFVRTRKQVAGKNSEPGGQHVKMTKLETVVSDALLERAVRAIQEHAHTGNPGDGKIFVYAVTDVIRIRTGERGESAI
jgi:nitrogen regulatory protein P-II 1